MIRNIKVLKNIGVFQNYEMRHSGLEKDFGKNNFIFGLNTYGKSTLCDVFKDANDNATERITDRKTISAVTDAQKIVISCDNGTVTFDNNVWKNNYLSSHVLVFDTEFVLNNVFDGTELTEDRATKENFTEFILGKEGVDRIQTIEQLKKSMKANKDQLKLEIPYSQKDCTDSEIKKYVKKTVKISEEIEKLKAEISKLAEEKELLSKRKGKLSEIQSFTSITSIEDKSIKFKNDLKAAESILMETFELPKGAIEKYKQHLSNNFTSNKEGESWIAKGLSIMKDSAVCPFCGQKTSESTIAPLYNSIFDKSYVDFVDNIHKRISQITISWDICNLYERLSEIIVHIQSSKDFSANLFDNEANEIEHFLKVIKETEKKLKEKLDFYRTAFSGATEMKKTFPTFQVPFSCDKTSELFKEYSEHIAKANVIINQINSKIEELKKQSDIEKIEKRINDINKSLVVNNENITRFNENEQCEKWKSLNNDIETQAKRIKKLTEELSVEQKQYLDSYFDSINRYFTLFGGRNYKIERGDLSNRGYKQVQAIKVLFHNKPIDKINHVFSESDKRALALSVFISKIINLPDDIRSNTIVIFDDPITSFDENRMTSVIMTIDELSDTVSQTFLFGHHCAFAFEIHRRCMNSFSFFEIRNTNNNSGLYELDTEMMFSNELIKSYLKMKRFVDGDSEEVTENEMRVFIEEYLKVVFAKYYKDNLLENKKFGECIDELHSFGAISTDSKETLHRFRVNLNPESHTFKTSTIEDNRALAAQIIDFIFDKVNLK